MTRLQCHTDVAPSTVTLSWRRLHALGRIPGICRAQIVVTQFQGLAQAKPTEAARLQG